MMIAIDGTLVSKGPGGVYGERMIGEYRVWDPYRSKLAALWYLDHSTDLPGDSVVLYLGAANGTTVSHVADYAEAVYAVEFAPRPMQDLLMVARSRRNIVPIYGDATQPQRYAPLLAGMRRSRSGMLLCLSRWIWCIRMLLSRIRRLLRFGIFRFCGRGER